MIVKNREEMEILKKGGQKLSEILNMVAEKIEPGVKAKDLNDFVLQTIKQLPNTKDYKLSFLGYKPEGVVRPYPAGLCVSVNDEVVHGIPNESEKVLKDGDIVTIDMGLTYKGLVTDHAVTLPVGEVDEKGKELISVTKKALDLAIEKARAGNNVGEIGFTIESFVKSKGFVPADDLGGHGVGSSVHEEPYVPNIGPKDRGPKLVPGTVIAIEPIINEGSKRIYLDSDGYTFKTADSKRSAQFEHTVLITNDNPIVLTQS